MPMRGIFGCGCPRAYPAQQAKRLPQIRALRFVVLSLDHFIRAQQQRLRDREPENHAARDH